jgi:ferric-dicitrate binding protein FerR (iron transport regulator)
MNCANCQPLLSAWQDQELPEQERAVVDAHLNECSSCRAVADGMRTLDDRLRCAFKPQQELAAQLTAHVINDLQQPIKISRQSVWRTALVATAAAAAGFILGGFALSRPETKPPTDVPSVQAQSPTLQLTVATGAVEVERNGNWQAMPTGGLVGCGEKIRTPDKARCEFLAPDGSEIRLNSNSELVFETPRKVNLKQGQVWSTVAKAPEPFEVIAAITTITALGTQFDFTHTPEKTQLSVLEGKTKVKDGQGKTCEVSAGQQLNYQGNRALQPIAKPEYELLRATNWVHEILVLKGRSNPELNRRIDDIFAGIGQTKTEFLLEEEIRVLGDHCVIPLTKYLLSDRSKGDDFKRQRAARIIADLAQPRSIGDLIPLLTDTDSEVRKAIAVGLHRLTGVNMDLNAAQCAVAGPEQCKKNQSAWENWWKLNAFRCPSDSK